MTQLVLALLAIAWIVVLAPDVGRLLRPRRDAATSVDRFRRQLDSLGRSAPAAVRLCEQRVPRVTSVASPRRWSSPPASMPATPQQAAVRRRDICTLGALCTVATLAGVLATRSLWALAALVVTGGVTVGYMVLAARRRRAGPTAQIHYLPVREPVGASTVTMVRRTASR